MADTKSCFVIGPIGEEGSETRKRSDQILNYIIAPVVKAQGYEPCRADQISDPGAITTQVIQRLVKDPLVIADLTGHNPNVFYELAIRHAYNLPVIQLIDDRAELPFDVATERTVLCDISDLDRAEATKQALIEQVEAIQEPDFEVRTPVSLAVDIARLKESGSPEQIGLAQVSQYIAEMRSMLVNLDRKIGDPASWFPPSFTESLLQLQRQPLPRQVFIASREIRSVALRAANEVHRQIEPAETGRWDAPAVMATLMATHSDLLTLARLGEGITRGLSDYP